ncbi:hypothetical protein FA13DRAFT_1727262 [Coprinellus micaceus]|uniref:Uncharacterized protein n=1 Tax=Coprinellus micaceus TaxID=71717 RepID=A0A4Y7TRU1_COPMI|nr:hypothetical protein FA13DRAFT_1727262 [Coprinellus micaceus]
MEPPSPFTQHFDTNYIPAASEITSIKKLIAHQQVVVDGIDGEIAKLDRRRNELVEQKRYHLEYIDKHREIISPARRLHPDILLTIFLLLASAPEPSWEHPLRTDGPIPAVVLSHVCRQWRELAVRSPLLWAYINISLPPFPIKTSPAVEGLTQGELEQYSAQLSQWKRRLAALCVQADLFVERSQGCPLHILFEAVDPRLSEDLSAEDDQTHKECWRAIFQPVLRAKGGSSNQCQSLRIRIKMSNPLSPLITLLAFPQMKNKELRHLELEITYENTETSREELWEGLANKINLMDAPITPLTARMPFVDIRRIHAGWSRLTSLSIGSPSPAAHFGPQDALNVLCITPNLVQCTIEFQGIRRQSVAPEQTAVSLPKLEGLTIRGSAPDVEFAAILDTPSLKRLSAMHDTGSLPAQDVDQSAVVEWVRRYGAQLTDVSFRYPSLTQPAFALVMGNLFEVKNLCLDAREETPFRISLEIGGGQTAARVETVLDAALLQRLTPKLDAEPAVEYICPKLETLACVLGDGHTEATKARFIDFIEARRKAVKAGRVRYLKKVDVKFRVGPVDTMLDDLGSRGVVPAASLSKLDMQTCI